MNQSSLTDGPSDVPAAFEVSVILEERFFAPGVVTHTEVVGVVAASPSGDGVIRSDEVSRQRLLAGFRLKLFPDEAESYYMNLTAEQPGVFVVCRQDEEGPLTPLLVTLSYDEAASYMEVEEPVFRVAMPPELYRWVENYVLQHFVPAQKKRRKREDWKPEDTP